MVWFVRVNILMISTYDFNFVIEMLFISTKMQSLGSREKKCSEIRVHEIVV